MGGMTTFGNNDSVFSHGEDSISMLSRLAEIAKEAYKYIPEKDCTVECGTFVDVDTRAFLSAVQHFRESIEAYRADCEYFRALAISRNKELEQRIKVLTAERDLAKKLAKQKSEELKRQLNEKYGTVVDCMEVKAKLDKKCREVGELTKELELEHEQTEFWRKKCMSLRESKEHSPAYWKAQFERMQKKSTQLEERIKLIKADRDRYFKQLHESGYFDTDITHMYPKTTLKLNNPQNFCGNCKHFVTHPCDIATCNNKHADPYIVDPDDASCPHFEPNQVDRDKPDQPCCEACNREDCDNCTLCPF